MESLLPLLINTLSGGAGGFLSNMLKKNNLGPIGNLLAGAVGGNALGYILPMIASGLTGGGGFSLAGILTPLIGGLATSLIGGFLKK